MKSLANEGDYIKVFNDENLYKVYLDDFGVECIGKDNEITLDKCDIYCKYHKAIIEKAGIELEDNKLNGVCEGDYVSIYTDPNIFYVMSKNGRLYIKFRGEDKYLDTFGNLLYKVYSKNLMKYLYEDM